MLTVIQDLEPVKNRNRRVGQPDQKPIDESGIIERIIERFEYNFAGLL